MPGVTTLLATLAATLPVAAAAAAAAVVTTDVAVLYTVRPVSSPIAKLPELPIALQLNPSSLDTERDTSATRTRSWTWSEPVTLMSSRTGAPVPRNSLATARTRSATLGVGTMPLSTAPPGAIVRETG